MNVNTYSSMQQTQTRRMDTNGGNQASAAMSRMMNETLAMLPEEMQSDIKSLMQTLDPEGKKDAMRQMSEIDASNMTVEDLSASIMDLFNPQAEAQKSSYPGSFSVYA